MVNSIIPNVTCALPRSGYKQRGLAAEEAMNVFIHLTYDGEVGDDLILADLLRCRSKATSQDNLPFNIAPPHLPHLISTLPPSHLRPSIRLFPYPTFSIAVGRCGCHHRPHPAGRDNSTDKQFWTDAD